MDEKVAQWFANTFVDLFNYEFGPHEAMFDEATQTKYWECWGCTALAETKWPTWGMPTLTHDPDCKFVALMDYVGRSEVWKNPKTLSSEL